jgi:hydrophobe/amphiphile efflux-1 (HAE1) family protein
MNNPPRRGIASWAISRPIGTLMITCTLLVLGLVYVGRIPVDLLPKIVYPQVQVTVGNPGVEPIVLEETIAKPLESALATVEGLERMETNIFEGRVQVSLNFAYGTNVDFALQDAATNVERVRSRLPEEAQAPVITKSDPSQQQIYQVAFSSTTRDLISLRQWVDQRLRPQILSSPGVASIEISGGLTREIQVELDPERLRGYGLTVAGVIGSLRNDNQNLAGGRVTGAGGEFVSRTSGKFQRLEDIQNVLLTSPSGTRVPLRDIAVVRDTSAEVRGWARLDGVPGVRLGIQKAPEANTVEVVQSTEKLLADLKSSGFIPADIRFEVTFDQSGFIRGALSSVRDAAIIGAILAMLVVGIFLRSFRKTFIIGVSIPLAILATFVMMGIGDLTLNIMSLGGLALGTGLLLDNAIVMLENIARRRTLEGLDSEEAAHVGAAEVTSAVVSSTTTNLASVAPFLLISGLTALLFRELILTISFAILASLPVGLTLVPMLSAQLGKIKFSSGLDRFPPLVAFDRAFTALIGTYRRVVAVAIRFRWVVFGAAAVLMFAAIKITEGIPRQFLPPVDDGSVGAFVRMSPGATPQETDVIVRQVESIVRTMPHVRSVFATSGARFGNLDVRLESAGDREMTAEAWVAQLQAKIDARGYAGARVGVRPPRIRGLRTSSSGEAVALTVVGDELQMLEEIGRSIAREMQGIPGLGNFDVPTEQPSPLLSIELDRERARALGLDVAQVGATVRTALDGTIVTQYADGNFEYDVRVFFPRGRFTSVATLGEIPLFPAGRGTAPIQLSDVATIAPALGPANVRRVNQMRQIQLTGDVLTEQASVGAVTDSIRLRLAAITLPDGYGTILGGEAEAIKETNDQLVLVVGLAIFLVFVVLAVQYESLIDPLVIIVAIPFALIGAVGALIVTGTPFSAPVVLGMILLAGIVVNNSILLVEFINQLRREDGVPAVQAVIEAGAARMRPIFMTTGTSLVGSLPLALGIGEGSELMQPLAIAVVGGLTLSTMLTLFVVPCTYLVVHSAGDRVKAFLLGRRPATAVTVAPPRVVSPDSGD